MKPARHVLLFLLTASLLTGVATAEVIYLNNGDIIHGELVAANNTEVTLKTDYGSLKIPKEDIQRIDYQDASVPAADSAASGPARRPPSDVPADRAAITLNITGRSFWYAFESPEGNRADTSIRLRLYIDSARACTFVDEKPDTVDGASLYNSFTFAPSDSHLLETLEGYECSVKKAEDGEVGLAISLPADVSTGRRLVRMLYEVNDGSREFPRWVDVVSRSFSIEVERGREAAVILEQDASSLEYSGFFKKSMKNLELFQLSVLSSELRD